jgi:pimeloyl-ACP methyl ester carboxylesterase
VTAEHISVAAKDLRSHHNNSDHQEDGLSLDGTSGFYAEPGACDQAHSKTYYCDGYMERSFPLSPAGANPTAEAASSNPPKAGTVGLQLIGAFNASRPSIIFVHGWNLEARDKPYGFPDQWARQANLAGFNVFAFQWASLSFDTGAGCPGFGFIGSINLPCNAAHDLYKANSATDKFLADYREYFSGYNQSVRIVAHSMGSQLSILATYRMYKRQDFANVKKPSRIDLVDPFMTLGLGGNRSKPFDGQIPPDETLPADYRANLVSAFKSGSKCHSWSVGFLWWNVVPANHLSQYCQNEGMAYALVKDHNVGMIDFNSILGGLTAGDFKNIMLFQSFNPRAFKGNPSSMHNSPNASYFYSFSPGTPANGYDASSSDEQILTGARKQAINNINMSRTQRAGFDTITLRDDDYR